MRQSALTMSLRGDAARYIGSILVPIDEIALCLFEATSMAAALELNGHAAIPSERVLEIVFPTSSAKESPVEPS